MAGGHGRRVRAVTGVRTTLLPRRGGTRPVAARVRRNHPTGRTARPGIRQLLDAPEHPVPAVVTGRGPDTLARNTPGARLTPEAPAPPTAP